MSETMTASGVVTAADSGTSVLGDSRGAEPGETLVGAALQTSTNLSPRTITLPPIRLNVRNLNTGIVQIEDATRMLVRLGRQNCIGKVLVVLDHPVTAFHVAHLLKPLSDSGIVQIKALKKNREEIKRQALLGQLKTTKKDDVDLYRLDSTDPATLKRDFRMISHLLKTYAKQGRVLKVRLPDASILPFRSDTHAESVLRGQVMPREVAEDIHEAMRRLKRQHPKALEFSMKRAVAEHRNCALRDFFIQKSRDFRISPRTFNTRRGAERARRLDYKLRKVERDLNRIEAQLEKSSRPLDWLPQWSIRVRDANQLPAPIRQRLGRIVKLNKQLKKAHRDRYPKRTILGSERLERRSWPRRVVGFLLPFGRRAAYTAST